MIGIRADEPSVDEALELTRRYTDEPLVIVVGSRESERERDRYLEQGAAAWVCREDPAAVLEAMAALGARRRGLSAEESGRLHAARTSVGSVLQDELYDWLWNLPDRIWIKDADLRIIYVNNAFARDVFFDSIPPRTERVDRGDISAPIRRHEVLPRV